MYTIGRVEQLQKTLDGNASSKLNSCATCWAGSLAFSQGDITVHFPLFFLRNILSQNERRDTNHVITYYMKWD